MYNEMIERHNKSLGQSSDANSGIDRQYQKYFPAPGYPDAGRMHQLKTL